MYQDSINFKWAGANSDSPAMKYEKAFGGTGVEDAVSKYHGIDAHSSRKACTVDTECTGLRDGSACAKRPGAFSGRCIPQWWGLDHAWTAASILLPEAKNPVTRNGVTFTVNDIKALVMLVHNSTNIRFVGLRCNLDAQNAGVNYDNYGRPSDPSCKDTNPATYHILLTNYLGIMKQSFVEDRMFDDEVWNQPLRAYRIMQKTEVAATEANRLIGATTTGGTTVNKTGTVATGVFAHQGSFTVAAGQPVKVVMTGTSDADLYVRFGALPTDAAYDCRPYAGATNETCELTAPAGATSLFVSVKGYAATSDFSLAITTGGAAPSNYVFNSNAVKFFHVITEVNYISESPSTTDGNLASRIDQYTRTDGYQYILEVDAAGKIIGDEWIGGSKTAHPDFLWLPISVRGASVAGGKITYANVKSLLDESVAGPTGGSSGAGKTVNESGTVARAAWRQFGPFNVAAGATLTATMTGTGDADLYVRMNAPPTLTSYDCRPYTSSTAESCSIVGPAMVLAGVNGFAATSSFALEIKYIEAGGAVTPPATFTHLNQSGVVAAGELKTFQLPIPAGKKVVIRTTSATDVDLYIQINAAPTTNAYLARGYTSSGNETITYTATGNGTLFVSVHGYAAGSFTVKTADQ